MMEFATGQSYRPFVRRCWYLALTCARKVGLCKTVAQLHWWSRDRYGNKHTRRLGAKQPKTSRIHVMWKPLGMICSERPRIATHGLEPSHKPLVMHGRPLGTAAADARCTTQRRGKIGGRISLQHHFCSAGSALVRRAQHGRLHGRAFPACWPAGRQPPNGPADILSRVYVQTLR
jgi:hypothetical protein